MFAGFTMAAAGQAGLEVASSRPDEWFLVGMVGMRLERLPLALKAFSRTLQDEPERSDAWANLGSIFLHMNQYDKAYHALNQVGATDGGVLSKGALLGQWPGGCVWLALARAHAAVTVIVPV